MPDPTPIPVSPPSSLKMNIRDSITNAAKSFQHLADMARTSDPEMWRQLTGKTTAYTMTPLGTALTAAVTYIAGKFGFGWDPDTCEFVAFALGTAGGYVIHYFTAKDLTKP